MTNSEAATVDKPIRIDMSGAGKQAMADLLSAIFRMRSELGARGLKMKIEKKNCKHFKSVTS